MKPDKPTTAPARDRDILRARNTRPLKPPGQPSSSSSSSSSTSDQAAGSSSGEPASASEASASTDVSGVSNSSGGSEMRVYLDKLRELVPYVPRSGRLSKVQLIHSAIDYITDLQESLEARARRKLRDKQDQASRPPLAALPQAHLHPNTPSTNPTTTTPLMENNANRLPTVLEANTSHPAALTALNLSTQPAGGSSSSSRISTSWLPPDLDVNSSHSAALNLSTTTLAANTVTTTSSRAQLSPAVLTPDEHPYLPLVTDAITRSTRSHGSASSSSSSSSSGGSSAITPASPEPPMNPS